MLVSVAIVPGPPAFVPELMGTAAPELDDLRHATDRVLSRAVADLVAASAHSSTPGSASPGSMPAQLVIVGAGESGEFNAGGPVTFASFGRDVVIPALVESRAGAHAEGTKSNETNDTNESNGIDAVVGAADRELPTPLMVARHLASRDVAAHPEHAQLWAAARWLMSDGRDGRVLGEQLRQLDTSIALILVADGATCHGPKAPRAEDSRAPAYQQSVLDAVASGDPAELASVDTDLGRELGATGPLVWPVLLAATDGEWVGELAWSGWPYGVGWLVAAWRRGPAGNGPVPG